MKRLLHACVTLLFSVIGQAQAADLVTFQLGWLPGGERAPVYLGVQRGLFAAENIEVKILAGRGSTDVITKLATGIADVGEVGFDAFLVAKATGSVPTTAVMPYFVKQPDSVLTTTTSGIEGFKDLMGRSIATSPFGTSILAWPHILKLNGIEPSSVRLIKAEPSTLGPMLASGRVDAMMGWSTTAPAMVSMLAQAGKQLRLIPWSRFGYEGYSQTLVASDKSLSERPEVVRRFLKVMRQSIELMHAEPEAAAQAVKAMVPQADLPTVRAQVEASVPLLVNEVTQRDGLGVFSPALLVMSWEWVAKANEFPTDRIDPNAVVTGQFVGPRR
jgi:NitT/TauT family transport system substrate-binding protein